MKELNEILRAVGRLEGKVDGINVRLDRVNGSLKNHNDRINNVESSTSNIQGKATMLGVLGGAIVAGVTLAVRWFK